MHVTKLGVRAGKYGSGSTVYLKSRKKGKVFGELAKLVPGLGGTNNESPSGGNDTAFWFPRFGSCVLSLAFWFCDLVMRFASRQAAFCLKTSCVLSQNKLRFALNLVAFCCKTRCVLLQSSLLFASKLVAFCFKARCVLLQDSLRFASRHLAFCFKTLAFCLKILAICLMVALRFVYF
nr:hypothetical protein [Tanacetum cinerariifolium]